MSENTIKPKKKKRFNWWKSDLIFLLVLFLLFKGDSLEISPETTYITEPLTADGKRVDYFRAIELETYPPSMKTDENGYRLIVRALGPSIDPSTPNAKQLSRQVYEKLGLDPMVQPTMTYQDPYDFLEKYNDAHKQDQEAEISTEEKTEDLCSKIDKPWTLETLPMMADWLDQNEPALDLIYEAVRRPEFCVPLVRSNDQETLLSNLDQDSFKRFRALARGLGVRAYYKIGAGDHCEAISDIITCRSLGRRVGKQGKNEFYGLAIENIASSIGIADALNHPPNKSQLKLLLRMIISSHLPERVSSEQAIRYRRFESLDQLQFWANYGLLQDSASSEEQELGEKLVSKAFSFSIDWNRATKRINLNYDDPAKSKQLSESFKTSLDSSFRITQILSFCIPSKRTDFLVNFLVDMDPSDTEWTTNLFHRTECIDNIQVITLAMLIYETQHGHLPPAYTVDQNGKPLHSWRVLLLPYLGKEGKELYAKLRLDEPWNSKHNRQFHDATIQLYQCPSVNLKPGQTTYSIVVGEKTAFTAGKGKKLDQFGPDSVNMILVTENATPACWMDPTSDLTEATAISQINKTAHPHCIIAGLRGGAVITIKSDTPEEELQQLLDGTAKELPY